LINQGNPTKCSHIEYIKGQQYLLKYAIQYIFRLAVYLQMFVSFNHNVLINCKAATFIKLPALGNARCFNSKSSVTVKEHVVSDLFTYERDNHRIIFHTIGNVIRFTSYNVEKYSSMSIIPLFDYKSKVYNFLSIDPKTYGNGPFVFVKAPNGNLYIIALRFSYKTDNLYRTSQYRLIIIKNLTSGNEIFRYDLEEAGGFVSREIQYVLIYTKPLYNSFIVLMRIGINNEPGKTYIYVVDLLKENVKEITYNLKNYITEHVGAFVYNLKEKYGFVFEVDNIFANARITVSYFPSPHLTLSGWEEISDDGCKLIKYEDKIPIYSQCEVTLLLQLETVTSHRTMYQQNEQETKLSCSFVIKFSAYIENNELNVMLACKGIQIRVSTDNYDVPTNDILLHEKYPINGRYNIDESRLYSIDALFDDYVFKNGGIYHWDGDSYKLVHKLSSANISMLKRREICFITANNQLVLAVIQPKLIEENPACIRFGNNRIVDLSKIGEIIKACKMQNKPLIIDVSEYIKTISVKESVEQIAEKIQGKRKKRRKKGRKKCEVGLYKSYTLEEAGTLYTFMLFSCVLIKIVSMKNRKIRDKIPYTRFAIVRHDIREGRSNGKIILLSHSYSYLLKHNIKSILLNEIINKIKNKEDRNIHFADFLKHLYDTSEKKNEILYLYNQNLIVKHKVFNKGLVYHVGEGSKYHVESIMEFKDIKYNRKYQLKCESASDIPVGSAKVITVQSSMKRYGNVAIHSFDVKVDTHRVDKSLNYVYKAIVVFSPISLVHSTQIVAYS
jgi:hypothetical protein